MLGNPVAGVAEPIGKLGEVERIAQRDRAGNSSADRRKIEDGKRSHGLFGCWRVAIKMGTAARLANPFSSRSSDLCGIAAPRRTRWTESAASLRLFRRRRRFLRSSDRTHRPAALPRHRPPVAPSCRRRAAQCSTAFRNTLRSTSRVRRRSVSSRHFRFNCAGRQVATPQSARQNMRMCLAGRSAGPAAGKTSCRRRYLAAIIGGHDGCGPVLRVPRRYDLSYARHRGSLPVPTLTPAPEHATRSNFVRQGGIAWTGPIDASACAPSSTAAAASIRARSMTRSPPASPRTWVSKPACSRARSARSRCSGRPTLSC